MLMFLAEQLVFERRAFVVREPASLVGPVWQPYQHDEAQNHGRDAPEDVNPLPADQTQDRWIIPHANGYDCPGDRGADYLRDRRPDEKPSQGPGTIATGKPMRQVDNHSRVEPGLGQTQQEPDPPELEHIDGTRTTELADQVLRLPAEPPEVCPCQRSKHGGCGADIPLGYCTCSGNSVVHERGHRRDDSP